MHYIWRMVCARASHISRYASPARIFFYCCHHQQHWHHH